MTSIFDQLNLRPHERRVVVGIAIVLFVVLNLWFVRPHFGDLAQVRGQMARANRNIAIYDKEIAKTSKYQAEKAALEGEGSTVLPEEQSLQFSRTVQSQAGISGVTFSDIKVSTQSQTNLFFQEQTLTMTVTSGEKELIDFLYKLATGGSMIRVLSMNLSSPDTYHLTGQLTLRASYQKNLKKAVAQSQAKPAVTPTTPAAKQPGPSTKAPSGPPPPTKSGMKHARS